MRFIAVEFCAKSKIFEILWNFFSIISWTNSYRWNNRILAIPVLVRVYTACKQPLFFLFFSFPGTKTVYYKFKPVRFPRLVCAGCGMPRRILVSGGVMLVGHLHHPPVSTNASPYRRWLFIYIFFFTLFSFLLRIISMRELLTEKPASLQIPAKVEFPRR